MKKLFDGDEKAKSKEQGGSNYFPTRRKIGEGGDI